MFLSGRVWETRCIYGDYFVIIKILEWEMWKSRNPGGGGGGFNFFPGGAGGAAKKKMY